MLRGRCYEYESVPFKALDGVVDSLSSSVGRPATIAGRSAASARPDGVVTALSRHAAGRRWQRPHAGASRRPPILSSCGSEPFTALRELLTRLAARQPLVVYIDDLHWADADSAVLLEELLRPPHAPPILMIACLRTEEIASKPFLQALLQRTGSNAGTEFPLEPMTDDEARTLLAFAVDGGCTGRRRSVAADHP